MICPNKEECRTHHCSAFQCLKPKAANKPTMAEIEGAVAAFHQRVVFFERDPSDYTRGQMNGSRAALVAAIRAYGEGK